MKRAPFRFASLVGVALGCAAVNSAADEDVDRLSPDFAALARQPMIPLPFPPKWVMAKSSQGTIEDVIAEFRKSTARQPDINYARRLFVRPDHEWLLAFVRWFRKLEVSLDMRYEEPIFDCDKYSRCFVAFADLLARKGGETRGSICVGWAIVFNDHDFAGIKAGISHSVVVVGTSDGFFIIEPQNGTIVPLADYPNRDAILAVNL
ncbi:MAG: hypothetical protein JWM88_1703 [Verrucomicrobia bacterium]|nr:hypothetical protein [Verrucomicrobiota bacterium]